MHFIMKNEETWRTFLDHLCRQMRADQKREFARDVDVSQATINRWRRGEDWPKTHNLERLLTILPAEQREQMVLLMRKDQKVWSLLPAEVRAAQGSELGSLAFFKNFDHFFLTMLRLQRDSPDPFWQMSGAILRECLKYLETHPIQVGIEIVMALFMPPHTGKVRSLRAIVGLGSSPWRGDLHTLDYFFGLNSLAGSVVTTRRGGTVLDLTQPSFHTPASFRAYERSAAAFPIMRVAAGDSTEMTIAGALIASCTQEDYFTSERLDILEVFTDIIRLALTGDHPFYPASLIELAPLPDWNLQRVYLETFWSLVTEESQRLSVQGQEIPFDEIQNRVWRQIEHNLLQRASSLLEKVTGIREN